jgi:hypothetical protein
MGKTDFSPEKCPDKSFSCLGEVSDAPDCCLSWHIHGASGESVKTSGHFVHFFWQWGSKNAGAFPPQLDKMKVIKMTANTAV